MNNIAASNCRIDEIADGIFRISKPVPPADFPGGFTYNQFLILDEKPMLVHTGMNRIFPEVTEAIARVIPVERLRYVAFSHNEADECGALNAFLELAPDAVPVCGSIGARTAISDFSLRPPIGLKHGESISLGRHTVRWLDAPHVPHGWDCGYLFEELTATLFCGDLFTQSGEEHEPVVESDILASSEVLRKRVNYYSMSPDTKMLIARLADCKPGLLACMHGSAWRGNGSRLLMQLADALVPAQAPSEARLS